MYEVFSKDVTFNPNSVSFGPKMGNKFGLLLLAFVIDCGKKMCYFEML